MFRDHLYLEDLDLPAKESTEAAAWASLLAPLVSPDDDIFTKRFAVVDDETMTFLWETATQVDARVRLDEIARTWLLAPFGSRRAFPRRRCSSVCYRREIDLVLVWRLDRRGQSVTDLLATLQELESQHFWPVAQELERTVRACGWRAEDSM